MPATSDEVVVVAHFTARPGRERELFDVLHSLLEPTRKEPACLRYELNQEVDNPRAFTFAEKFVNREAFEALPVLVEKQYIGLHRQVLA